MKSIRYYCLVMSEDYIRSHHRDIMEYANVIEKRVNDDCTLESLLHDNAEVLKKAKANGVNYLLIDHAYEINIEEFL